MVPEKNKYVFLVFILTSLVLRFYSFFQGVIDHDESTYLIIGRDIALGKHLYVDVTDTKPVGIFLIYAFFYKVFGYSIFLTRFVVSMVVALTSWFLYLVAQRLSFKKEVAFAAGLIYIFYTSVWSQFGISPNTEQFFNLTTAAGLLFLLKGSKWSYLVSGLIFGVGFIIKYLVLFDFLFLFGFFMARELYLAKWKIAETGIFKYLLAGVGFSVPFLLSNVYFYLIGDFEAFRYITYELPSKYGENPAGWGYIVMLLDFAGRFFPLTLMFFYGLFSKREISGRWQVGMFLAWISGILIAIYLPGKSFDHYTIQLMLPFSLVAALFFHPQMKKAKIVGWLAGEKVGPLLLVTIVVIVQASAIAGVVSEKDSPRKVASYLNQTMKPGDTLYLSNYKHIVYYLTKKECPTKYVHPTILTNPAHSKAFGVDGPGEIERIVGSKPTFIVIKKPYPYMEVLINGDYKVEKTFFDGIVIIYKIER